MDSTGIGVNSPCITGLHCCPRGCANEALGHGVAGGAVLVQVLDVELIHDGM